MRPQDDVSLSFDANPGLTYPQHRRVPPHQPEQPPQYGQPPGYGQQYPAFPGPAANGPPGMAFMTFDMAKQNTMPPPPRPGFGPPPSYDNSGLFGTQSFDDEPPLLEELGINIQQIIRKTTAALNPVSINPDLYEDGDLSGPLIFCVLFGACQLLSAKVHFGVILGWTTVASVFIWTIFNLLVGARADNAGIDLYRCTSIIGYSLPPIVLFSLLSLVIPRKGFLILAAAATAVGWSTRTASTLLLAFVPQIDDLKYMLAYVCFLVFAAFSLLVLF